MEIHNLQFSITEQDFRDLVAKHLPKNFKIKNHRFGLQADALHFSGEYPIVFRVPFSTTWRIFVQAGLVAIRLHHIEVMGFSVSLLKQALLQHLHDTARGASWLSLRNETFFVDVENYLADDGIFIQLNLRHIHCQRGYLLIEAGHPDH